MRTIVIAASAALLALGASLATAHEPPEFVDDLRDDGGPPAWVADVIDAGGRPAFVTTGAPEGDVDVADGSAATAEAALGSENASVPEWVADVTADGGPPAWVEDVKTDGGPPAWVELPSQATTPPIAPPVQPRSVPVTLPRR